jgi:hypothetical protein
MTSPEGKIVLPTRLEANAAKHDAPYSGISILMAGKTVPVTLACSTKIFDRR